ncbi:MAG: 16S rRNA (cytidine(1402)-2'-O)-methyltransferase [Buchnera aphidicola (Floraphis choui)]
MKQLNNTKGILYIIPTPIGNLADITYRAISTLNAVDIIAAENINHTKILTKKYNIFTHITSFNKHNEKTKYKKLIIQLRNGKNIALVSNAGTPTINDPGNHLINNCYEYEIQVIPLPGPCAAITALSASGLSNRKFCYEGFFPSRNTIRRKLINSLNKETRTIIVYETPHRIISSMNDIVKELGPNRYIILAKELTKKWECIKRGTSESILSWLNNDNFKEKGEITIIISGFQEIKANTISEIALETLQILKLHLPLKEAIQITAKLHKLSKNFLYNYNIKK